MVTSNELRLCLFVLEAAASLFNKLVAGVVMAWRDVRTPYTRVVLNQSDGSYCRLHVASYILQGSIQQ